MARTKQQERKQQSKKPVLTKEQENERRIRLSLKAERKRNVKKYLEENEILKEIMDKFRKLNKEQHDLHRRLVKFIQSKKEPKQDLHQEALVQDQQPEEEKDSEEDTVLDPEEFQDQEMVVTEEGDQIVIDYMRKIA